MKQFIEPLKSWFGYTRPERRSTFILLIIMLIVFGLRFVVPARTISVEEIPLKIIEENTKERIVAEQKPQGNFPKKTVVQKRTESYQNHQKKILELNTCDTASLRALPGIGSVLSLRIIKYRNLIGGFVSVNQLREVYGLSEETFKKVLPKVCADSLLVRKIKINRADYKALIRHPYFKKDEIQGIIKYRELKGKIGGLEEMVRNNIISRETTKKIKPYLDFD